MPASKKRPLRIAILGQGRSGLDIHCRYLRTAPRKFKIIFSCFQIISLLPGIFTLTFPENFTKFLDTLDLINVVPNLFGGNNTGLGTANMYYLRAQGNDAIGMGLPWWEPGGGENHPDAILYMQNIELDGQLIVEDGAIVGPSTLAKVANELEPLFG